MESSSKPYSPHHALLRIHDSKTGRVRVALNEHPYLVRVTHWVSAISIIVMTFSGIEIFRAFPTFGAKIPQRDLINIPTWLGLGGWLGGSLEWHLTFMWPLIVSGMVYLHYQIVSGNYRQVLFTPKDMRGVWPMARHYFHSGPKPDLKESYNPLQKLAYTSAMLLGILAVLTGLVLCKPVQLSTLAWMLGGFGMVRVWHFAAMLGLASFIPGHLVMVALHGWTNFYSMLIGWKTDPGHIARSMDTDADKATR